MKPLKILVQYVKCVHRDCATANRMFFPGAYIVCMPIVSLLMAAQLLMDPNEFYRGYIEEENDRTNSQT